MDRVARRICSPLFWQPASDMWLSAAKPELTLSSVLLLSERMSGEGFIFPVVDYQREYRHYDIMTFHNAHHLWALILLLLSSTSFLYILNAILIQYTKTRFS